MSDPLQSVREHVLFLFKGGQAYDTFEDTLNAVPHDKRYTVATGCGHSAWQVLEHMNRTLRDIVAFTDNVDGTYQELNWPDDYWPKDEPSEGAWEVSQKGYLEQLEKLKHLVQNGDLLTAFPWGDGQTLLREALLAADHEGYHLGQIVLITRVLKS